MRSPNLNALRMFDAAARHLNFRRAAEELHLTQGAVAQQVRRLEDRLGLRLLHRTTRDLSLTEEGATFYQGCQRMIAEAESLGANAVVNVRFSTSSVAQGAAELFAYGTAVQID